MILTAHQPSYLGYLGLFQKLDQADLFLVLDSVPFERHGFGNRNYIKSQNGPQLLTVPIHLNDHFERPISEIRICYDHNWRRKHLRSIELAYKKAPYFSFAFPRLEEVYRSEYEYLSELDLALLRLFVELLGITTEIRPAPPLTKHKSELVLEMCQKVGATEYIFGAMGRDYANVPEFEAAGVKVHFQAFQHPVYPQLHGPFAPRMSVIDLLCNVGPSSLLVLKGQ